MVDGKQLKILLVPGYFRRGRGVIPSLVERGEQSCQPCQCGCCQFGMQRLKVWSGNTTYYTVLYT
jgi:hypothetical protein